MSEVGQRTQCNGTTRLELKTTSKCRPPAAPHRNRGPHRARGQQEAAATKRCCVAVRGGRPHVPLLELVGLGWAAGERELDVGLLCNESIKTERTGKVGRDAFDAINALKRHRVISVTLTVTNLFNTVL